MHTRIPRPHLVDLRTAPAPRGGNPVPREIAKTTRNRQFGPPCSDPGTRPSTPKAQSVSRPNQSHRPPAARASSIETLSVRWIPPLQKVDRNDTRPTTDRYKARLN